MLQTIAKRVGQGFRKIDQMLFLNYQSQQEQKQPSPKKSWRTRNKPSPEHEINKKVERYDLDLMEGKIFDLEIGGDIRIAADDPGSTYTGLQFHERLAESYRRFIVEPHPIGQGKTLTGIIKVGTLHWRHNERDGISNHQPRDCLLNHLFRGRPQKVSKLHVTGLCNVNSLVTAEFPIQRASYAENVSIWWRHHEEGWELRVLMAPTLLSRVHENAFHNIFPYYWPFVRGIRRRRRIPLTKGQ